MPFTFAPWMISERKGSAPRGRVKPFAKMRADVHDVLAQLRTREYNADPLQCLSKPEYRQLLAAVFVSVHGA